ncbi:MAG: hypothetical protein JRJ87_13485 [Deltaproteobacteria bacterium]|nr:hypothetical protein [Deltaproteobacteria bacterium]
MGKSAEIVFCRPKQVLVVTYFLLGVLMFAVSGFMAWGLAIGYPLRLHPVWVWIFFAASLLTGLFFFCARFRTAEAVGVF